MVRTNVTRVALLTCYTSNEDMDTHDCEILKSILNDGKYEMSAYDVATVETVISTFTSPTPVTDL